MKRKLKAIHATISENIAGLNTQRAMPSPFIEHIDPFLFLNHHGPQTYPPNNLGLPFEAHPHRGFETVTFILDGEVAHKDGHGHESLITAGGMQWMTAGKGIVHEEVSSEDFKKKGGQVEFLQLWVNLPRKYKMIEPRYIGLQKEELSTYLHDGVTITPYSGKYLDHLGPIDTKSGITLMALEFPAQTQWNYKISPEQNIFCYLVRGEININDQNIKAFHLIEFENTGDEIHFINRATQNAYLLLGHGRPFNEPIVSRGPFVMNTIEEIYQAYEDYRSGRFSASSF